MPGQDDTPPPPAAPGEPGQQPDAVERDTQPTSALTSASTAVQRADELRRSAAAVLQRADTRLRRADACSPPHAVG